MAITLLKKIEQAKALIKEVLETHKSPCVAFSFGKDSVLLLHLIRQIQKDIPVVAILSDTEFDETYAYRDELVKDWGLNYKEFRFKNDPTKGMEGCCRDGKVEIFKDALDGFDCWFSGVRKDEGLNRTEFKYKEEKDGLLQVNPILDFTEKDVWRYHAMNNIKVNPIYKKGYRSLSCKNCSAPERDENESERAGRWVGTSHKGGECGIHTK